MGKLLFVGVTCADVVINVDRLPRTAQDVVVYGQRMTLGGCAFNAFAVAHALGEPAVLFSPVGTGAFGDFVRKGLAAEGVPVLVENGSMENGCCYCFVEPDGERTFVAYHGADYHYEPAWFDALDMDEIDAVYVCGLEVEDPIGPVVVEFLERCCADKTICFTPGPRPDAVPLDLLERVCDLHPVLHMNGDEAMVLAGRLCGGTALCAGDGESPARDCGWEGADPAADSEVREMSGAVPGAACRTPSSPRSAARAAILTMGPAGASCRASPPGWSTPSARATRTSARSWSACIAGRTPKRPWRAPIAWPPPWWRRRARTWIPS